MPDPSAIARQCLANQVRLLGRAVSAVYDEELRPLGLKVSQLNVLVAIATLGAPRPSDLAGALRVDKSTLSRNTERMRRSGWLATRSGEGRSVHLTLTAAGRRLLERATPAWERAQDRARELIGARAADELARSAKRLRRLPPTVEG